MTDPAQRAKQTARRKAIYVELHPETGQTNTPIAGTSMRKVAKLATLPLASPPTPHLPPARASARSNATASAARRSRRKTGSVR